MKIFTIFVVLSAATQRSETIENTTLPLRERVALLKYQIAKEIGAEKLIDGQQRLDDPSFENIEYVDTENQPITPISENDERKKHGRYLLRKLKTPTTTLWPPLTTAKAKKPKKKPKPATEKKKIEIVADDLQSSSEDRIPKLKGIDKILHSAGKNRSSKLLRNEKLAKSQIESQKNIFYRRIFDLETLKKRCPKEIIHCTTLLTPLLTGQKQSFTVKKILTYDDNEVMRLLQLFNEDPTDLTQEEIMSTLYQISNMQIRLFQWNIASLKTLFKVLTKGSPQKSKQQTWRSLKAGVKRLLAGWKLDFTNVTNLLHEARLFRPPCIASGQVGSTLSSRVSLYTTRKVKRKCSRTEDSSGSCERG